MNISVTIHIYMYVQAPPPPFLLLPSSLSPCFLALLPPCALQKWQRKLWNGIENRAEFLTVDPQGHLL